ncbi:MAG: GNAT family N-acetyltransferase [Bacillota bacterium]
MARVLVYDSFDSLPASCAALFRRAAADSGVFLSLPWFRTLAAAALCESPLRIYALASDADTVHALMPMRAVTAHNRFFSVRQLTAAANFYTPLFAPLVADSVSGQAGMEALARAIAAEKARWDTVALYPMDGDNRLYAATLSVFRAAGMAVQPYHCFANWYLKVDGRSFCEYAASLPPRLRNTLKRKEKQLAGGRLRVEIITGGADLERGIEAYHAVYRASWKPPEAFPQFMPELIRCCAREGWLRLGVAYIDGQPAAAQVWIVAGGVASIYKLAYDQAFVKYSAGSLLTARLMQHVIDLDGVHEVDFRSGDDAYKRDWMSHRRERRGIIAFNLRTFKGIALAAVNLGGRAVKHILWGECGGRVRMTMRRMLRNKGV